MFYDKVAGPPAPGSLQEVVCILVQQYRREQKINALWLLGSGDPRTKQEAFEAYKDSLAPYVSRDRARMEQHATESMQRIFEQGGITIMLDDDNQDR